MLDIATIIVSWNVRDYLAQSLSALHIDLARGGLRNETWVSDNGSTDGTQALLKNVYPHTNLIQNKTNVGFGAANNQGMKAAMAKHDDVRYFLLLNPDTLVRPNTIYKMMNTLENAPKVGMVGAKLVYGDGRFQHSAFAFPGLAQLMFDLMPVPNRLYESRVNGRYPRTWFQAGQAPFSVDFILGAAMLVRRNVAETTGGFDESFHIYCEEIAWCWRIREAGWDIRTVPQAEIVHYGGKSTKQVPAESIINLWRSRAQLYEKHHNRLVQALASRVAQWGLTRRASQAKIPSIQNAYLESADQWRK